jgi:hypothetical protein
MGAVIGGLIGGIGSLFGGNTAEQADKKAAGQALTGYNYLTGPQGTGDYVASGKAANSAESELLGTAPMTDQTRTGFSNYLNSTGYQFQLGQGTAAITGSAAARGILNSGATAKALTKYGQGLAGSSFNNYLDQLSGQAGRGLTAQGQIGQAGTAGGANAAQATQAGGEVMQTGITKAAGIGAGTLANFFAGV